MAEKKNNTKTTQKAEVMPEVMPDEVPQAVQVEKNAERRVAVRLPRLPGQNAIQEEFFSVNGKNYLIKRGETVEIPEAVAEVIRNAEKADEYAMQYVDNLAQAEKDKKEELGIQ
ncbi:MAG: hypothetical protein IJB80_05550 [Clostridia bacterium]|nr:hypothetical protein [Clostridia bacterium]